MSCCKDPPSPPPATTDNDHSSSSHVPRPRPEPPAATSPESRTQLQHPAAQQTEAPLPYSLPPPFRLSLLPVCPCIRPLSENKAEESGPRDPVFVAGSFRVRSPCRNRARSPLTHLFLSLLWCLPPLLKVPLTPSRPAAPPARRLPATSIIAHLSPSTTTYRPPPPRASPTPTTTTYYDLPGPAARHDLLVLPPV